MEHWCRPIGDSTTASGRRVRTWVISITLRYLRSRTHHVLGEPHFLPPVGDARVSFAVLREPQRPRVADHDESMATVADSRPRQLLADLSQQNLVALLPCDILRWRGQLLGYTEVTCSYGTRGHRGTYFGYPGRQRGCTYCSRVHRGTYLQYPDTQRDVLTVLGYTQGTCLRYSGIQRESTYGSQEYR